MVDSGVRVTEMGCDVPSNTVAHPVKKNVLIKEPNKYFDLDADRFFIKLPSEIISLCPKISHIKLVGLKIKYFTNFTIFHEYFFYTDDCQLVSLKP